MARDPTRRRRKRPADVVSQRPWRRVRNPYKPIAVLSADQIEHIHRASLDVIETLGADVWCDEALDIFAAAGAEVDQPNRHVRIDRAIIEDAVAKAPAEFTLTPRNPERAIVVGGNSINFSIVAGPGFSTDLDRGRRSGTFADACDLIRLSQCLEVIHLTGGGPVAATDMAVPIRHLETLRASLTLTDKVSYGSAFGARRVNDAIDMTCIVRGVDRAGLAASPGLIGNINCNSPLRYDGPMTEGIIEFARAGQPIIITPFTLAGAMAPITLAGALTQQNAEALIGIALAQLVNPGAPVVYGGFTSNVDMKSGAPAFGTPEYAKSVLAGGQLARRHGLPYRSSNVNASNVVDAQAAYESGMSLWSTVMGHCNLMLHGAGWLEGGLTASFEKMIIDAEMLQMMAAFLEPLEVSDATLGLDAMAEAGPGGHFFGTKHTLERYETAFYAPMVSDWRNYETWEEHGSLSATQRANRIWKRMLKDYELPAMDAAIREELDAFVAKRSEEGGVPI
jgi:trimethylamine--corrinoid protein Co-methyltransferase